VLAPVPGAFKTGAAPGTNLCQRQANDHEVQEKKSFDWSGPRSEGPFTLVSEGSSKISETRDEHAVGQIDCDVFEVLLLGGDQDELPAGD
jgi:hypothetical protein